MCVRAGTCGSDFRNSAGSRSQLKLRNHLSTRPPSPERTSDGCQAGAIRELGENQGSVLMVLDEDVAKRRAIVNSNPNLSAKELCAILDHHRIAVPKEWKDADIECGRRHIVRVGSESVSIT